MNPIITEISTRFQNDIFFTWGVRFGLVIAVFIVLYWLFRHLFNYLIKTSEKKRGKPIAHLESVKNFTKRLFGLITCSSLLLVLQDVYVTQPWLYRVVSIAMVIQLVYVFHYLGKLFNDIYGTYEVSKTRPLTSIVQVIEAIIWALGGIWIVSIVTQQDPGTLLVSVSALFAALSFVFRDMIVNFVSGLQLTSTDMLKIGDRIIVENSIDGVVESITVNSVQLKNSDQTLTTMPATTLMSTPFKNYRNSVDLQIRRFRRVILIDAKTIHQANQKHYDYSEWNETEGVYTNLYLYREKILAYLNQHAQISKRQNRLVQIKDPTPQGIPVEIVAFTTISDYIEHENATTKMMDYFLLELSKFDLEVYQSPSSYDLKEH